MTASSASHRGRTMTSRDDMEPRYGTVAADLVGGRTTTPIGAGDEAERGRRTARREDERAPCRAAASHVAVPDRRPLRRARGLPVTCRDRPGDARVAVRAVADLAAKLLPAWPDAPDDEVETAFLGWLGRMTHLPAVSRPRAVLPAGPRTALLPGSRRPRGQRLRHPRPHDERRHPARASPRRPRPRRGPRLRGPGFGSVDPGRPSRRRRRSSSSTATSDSNSSPWTPSRSTGC